MRFNKLILGAALVVPIFMTSCGDPVTEPLTISYIGESSYTIAGDDNYAIFTLPFKLSRELKNGEKMDEVRFTATEKEVCAKGSNFRFSVNGTSLTLSTKVTLDDGFYSGFCSYEFSINALKASGAPLAELIQPQIPFNISQKNIVIDCGEDLDKLLSDNEFSLDYISTPLTKDNKTVTIIYTADTGASTDLNLDLGLFEDGETEPLQTFTNKAYFDHTKTEEEIEIELGTLSDDNWKLIESGDTLYIDKVGA